MSSDFIRDTISALVAAFLTSNKASFVQVNIFFHRNDLEKPVSATFAVLGTCWVLLYSIRDLATLPSYKNEY